MLAPLLDVYQMHVLLYNAFGHDFIWYWQEGNTSLVGVVTKLSFLDLLYHYAVDPIVRYYFSFRYWCKLWLKNNSCMFWVSYESSALRWSSPGDFPFLKDFIAVIISCLFDEYIITLSSGGFLFSTFGTFLKCSAHLYAC